MNDINPYPLTPNPIISIRRGYVEMGTSDKSRTLPQDFNDGIHKTDLTSQEIAPSRKNLTTDSDEEKSDPDDCLAKQMSEYANQFSIKKRLESDL